jgi:hypothetical protein
LGVLVQPPGGRAHLLQEREPKDGVVGDEARLTGRLAEDGEEGQFSVDGGELVVLDDKQILAALADVDRGDAFEREVFAVGEGEPLSEELEVAGVGAEGVGAPARGREVSFEAVQELLQRHVRIHVSPLV